MKSKRNKHKVLHPMDYSEKIKANFTASDSEDSVVELSSLIDEIKRKVSLFNKKLENIPLNAALDYWLSHSGEHGYVEYIHDLRDNNIIKASFADGKAFTVGGFKLIRHQAAIDCIKNIDGINDKTKKGMIECYISIINYLDSLSYGFFKREILSRPGEYKMSPGAAASTLSFSDWRTFIDMLYEINDRDSIIARLIMLSGKRISEVLALTKDQIDYKENKINFKQGKHELSIIINEYFMKELKEYVNSTEAQRRNSPTVFITKTGKQVTRARLNYSFAHISSIAGITRVSPETLRAVWLALKQQGYKDFGILANKKDRRIVRKGETDVY